jgi:hypothetical protein
MAVKTAEKGTKKDYRVLRACISVTLKEHLLMGAKEVQVTYLEYETWAGLSRKLIFKSKAGEDIIRSGSERSMLNTNGYFITDNLPTLPKRPLDMVRKIAEGMGLKVVQLEKGKIVIKRPRKKK